MEILKLVGKREGVLEFGNRSNCHAAKFIKEYYAKYIEANQIEADLETNESPQLGDEIVKVINEHQSKFDNKIQHWGVLVVGFIFIFKKASVFWKYFCGSSNRVNGSVALPAEPRTRDHSFVART